MTAKTYPPLPRGNPELGEDSYTAQHMRDFADATCDLRLSDLLAELKVARAELEALRSARGR